MKFVINGRRHGPRAAAVVLSVSALLVACLTPATASPIADSPVVSPADDPAASADIAELIRTQDHPMGSQIRLHEGTAEMPRSVTPADIGIQATVAGIDVSGWQGNVDWSSYWNQG